MIPKSETPIIKTYLDLLDTQREQAVRALIDLTDDQIWQRPAPKEWCIGEILNHNVLLFKSFFPFVKFAWRFFRWTGRLLYSREYKIDISDPYRKKSFPHWVGFLWKPKYTPDKPVSLEVLVSELCNTHHWVRDFYEGKDEAMLGNVFVFDPLFGFLNLIVALRIGLHHDQLHYEDVFKISSRIKDEGCQH